MQLRYKGTTAQVVPEYASLEIQIFNVSFQPIQAVSLWLGQRKLQSDLTLIPNSTFIWPYNVGDLIGQLTFELKTAEKNLAKANVTVVPQKLTLDETTWIITDRLPTLLTRLEAPNRISLNYNDNELPPFDFVSADYTALRLRYFYEQLNTLLEPLLSHLDYANSEKKQHETGYVPSNIQWPKTIRSWSAQPVETGLIYHHTETNRNYTTVPNRLLAYFGQTLISELTKLIELVNTGVPASKSLRKALPEFETYAYALENNLRKLPVKPEPDFTFEEEALQIACNSTSNPIYAELADLWQDFSKRYVKLADAVIEAGLQPMSKIYELWAVCEIAHALDLHFEHFKGLESGIFVSDNLKLYYNQAAKGGWYSSGRRNPPRPDIRLELAGGQQALLDVKYRGDNTERALADDVYRMLAYMNDFETKRGAIIFPGLPNQTDLLVIEKKGQRLAEFRLRPPATPAKIVEWQVALKADLMGFIN